MVVSFVEALSNDSKTKQEVVLECKDLAFAFNGSPPIFQDVNITTYKDELIAVVGPTGTGKSTLLRVLSCLLTASKGHVYLYGKEVTHPSSRISLIHQSIATFPWMTALENVRIGLRGRKDIKDEQAEEISL